MYERILVPTDGSPVSWQALPYAELVAKKFSSSLELLYCLDTEEIPDDVAATVENELIKELQRVAGELPKNLKTECVVASGRPADVIVDRAATEPGNLIALCTHGNHGLNRWILGSVTTKVVQAARSPVLVVRARSEKARIDSPRIDKIVVPLDGSDLAEKALSHAVAIAKSFDAEVVLIRAYQTRLPGSSIRMYKVTEIVRDAAASYLERIAEQLRPQGLKNISCEVLHGRPAGEIIDYASKIPNSLITLSSHGRSGVGRWMLGSVTTAVIRHIEQPVLVTRAD
jgi:nucleotide-binding universal stress UspA family protein